MSVSILQKEWKTKSGHDAKVIWVNNSHRCGYVRIPEDHPLFGIDYSDDVIDCHDYLKDKEVGKRSPISIFCAAGRDLHDAAILFDCHGGITFSGKLGHDGKDQEGFWYGYDCAHSGDLTQYMIEHREWCMSEHAVMRSLEYCIDECESLSRQLEEVKSIIVIKKGENNG